MARRITPIAATLFALGAQVGIVYAAGFDQPAQPLAQALGQFTRQAGLQLLTAPELLRGQQAQAIQGARNASEAVGQMLRGTGLHGRIDGRTLVIEAAPPANDVVTLSDVKVTAQAERAGGLPEAYAGGQVARGGRLGMLGNKDFMETPFSVSSYTEQTAANLQATTVADVLVNDPSVGLEGSKLGWLGNFNIRGFTVQSNDTTIKRHRRNLPSEPPYPHRVRRAGRCAAWPQRPGIRDGTFRCHQRVGQHRNQAGCGRAFVASGHQLHFGFRVRHPR